MVPLVVRLTKAGKLNTSRLVRKKVQVRRKTRVTQDYRWVKPPSGEPQGLRVLSPVQVVSGEKRKPVKADPAKFKAWLSTSPVVEELQLSAGRSLSKPRKKQTYRTGGVLGGVNESYRVVFDKPMRSEGRAYEAAVFKPSSGEVKINPLVPQGTYATREVLFYEAAQAMGSDVVPCTAMRDDPVHGRGSAQAWVDNEGASARDACMDATTPRQCRRIAEIALLDVLLGNMDRHWKNMVVDSRGDVWAIDNALCLPENVTHAGFTSEVWSVAKPRKAIREEIKKLLASGAAKKVAAVVEAAMPGRGRWVMVEAEEVEMQL